MYLHKVGKYVRHLRFKITTTNMKVTNVFPEFFKRHISIYLSLQVDCVTLGLEHAAVQQDGGGRCVMTLVLLEPTERTAPAPVCVRTRETVILSLASVTVPWDGR